MEKREICNVQSLRKGTLAVSSTHQAFQLLSNYFGYMIIWYVISKATSMTLLTQFYYRSLTTSPLACHTKTFLCGAFRNMEVYEMLWSDPLDLCWVSTQQQLCFFSNALLTFVKRQWLQFSLTEKWKSWLFAFIWWQANMHLFYSAFLHQRQKSKVNREFE